MLVRVDDVAQPCELLTLAMVPRLRAERVGHKHLEFGSLAAQFGNVTVGAGDVLAGRVAVGPMGRPTGAGGLSRWHTAVGGLRTQVMPLPGKTRSAGLWSSTWAWWVEVSVRPANCWLAW